MSKKLQILLLKYKGKTAVQGLGLDKFNNFSLHSCGPENMFSLLWSWDYKKFPLSTISLIVGFMLMPGVSLYACNLSNDLVLALQLSLYTTHFIFRKLGKCVLNGNLVTF